MRRLDIDSRFVSGVIYRFLHREIARVGFGLASYRQPGRREDLTTLRKMRQQQTTLITPLEGAQIMAAVRATSKRGGSMAEVGVYRGGSARVIRLADAERPLHLFDTFEGLPSPKQTDEAVGFSTFRQGDFACSLENVQRYLQDLPNIYFHKGLFPLSAVDLAINEFSFVHIDVDLYQSAFDAIAWFYPRMKTGGIILGHDFATCVGPQRAFTEFFANRQEPLIALPGDQVLVVKL
jgi:O-methyltransferase